MDIQAILETGHCRNFTDVWRQSIPRSDRKNSKSCFPSGKMKTWLTDLEVFALGCYMHLAIQRAPPQTVSGNRGMACTL